MNPRARWLILSLALSFLLVPLAPGAQQREKLPRIGWLSVGGAGGPRRGAFSEGLRALGYVEGRTIVIERRSAEGRLDRLPALAAELVRLKVDVIAALEPPAARAAKEATRTIPIVIRTGGDPVEEGFVASLSRPGGNVTGVSSQAAELGGKRLELLREVVPGLSRVGVLWNPGYRGQDLRLQYKELQGAARALGLELQSLEVRSPAELEGAFRVATRERAGALITLRDPLVVLHRKKIAALAAGSRLPAIYDDVEFVEAGGLMSYGADLAALYRRAAYYVDKILKGAKPADLPVEQPTKFELVVNLKAAKALGLTIPPEVLLRADRVIK